jgi:hypothetical protein
LKGFEVKWGEKAEAKRVMIGKMKQFAVLSKGAFREKPLMVPVSALLACMDV